MLSDRLQNMPEANLYNVNVDLGPRSYEILIDKNLIENTGTLLKSKNFKHQFSNQKYLIVTDQNVAKLHLNSLKQSLEQSGIHFSQIVLPAGEKTKSIDHLIEVINKILDEKLERKDTIIAFGGGVIGDLTGFAAGIARRGMSFIQIPTSLLAQVDSSVGGKTGINTHHGKNLIGVFHQPDLVIADSNILDTLPKREFQAGYAEIVKYGLINKPDFFYWLEKNWQQVFENTTQRRKAISQSCQAKAEIITSDEYETANRALLNLGHTFGHALEAATQYNNKRLVHGEAVAIGINLAYRFSAYLNITDIKHAERIAKHLDLVGLPKNIIDIPGDKIKIETLINAIMQDKKITGGELNFILAQDLGKAFIAKNIPINKVESFLKENT